MIDCGANVDARPEHLVQFAKMGSIYMEHVVGRRIREWRLSISVQKKRREMLW